ncbi:hypothetical protein Saso_53410 [Streptomyces asoensis]|uniref:Uncharacterized protein n=1 Tax=Streptomyces asoensis TaxID=249586 RepID=A0ABQ3S6D7_9ACTN|nr:hypothetical protein GCM10010496_48200 [Streptomyces asoensis]GHI63691.1 hypothetical protein Saso_53410 [Streptomyces asoensis]
MVREGQGHAVNEVTFRRAVADPAADRSLTLPSPSATKDMCFGSHAP